MNIHTLVILTVVLLLFFFFEIIVADDESGAGEHIDGGAERGRDEKRNVVNKQLEALQNSALSIIGAELGSDAFRKFASLSFTLWKKMKDSYKYMKGHFTLPDNYFEKWWPKVVDVITEGDSSLCVPKKVKNLELKFKEIVRRTWAELTLDPVESLDVVVRQSLTDFSVVLKVYFYDEFKHTFGAAAIKSFLNDTNLTYISWVWDDLPEERKNILDKMYDRVSSFKRILIKRIGEWWDTIEEYIADNFEYYVENPEDCRSTLEFLGDKLYNDYNDPKLKMGIFRPDAFREKLIKDFVHLAVYGGLPNLSSATVLNLRKYLYTRHWETLKCPELGDWRPIRELMVVFIPNELSTFWWHNLSRYLNNGTSTFHDSLNTKLSLHWFNATQTAANSLTKVKPDKDIERVLNKAFYLFQEQLKDINLQKKPVLEFINNKMDEFMNLDFYKRVDIVTEGSMTAVVEPFNAA